MYFFFLDKECSFFLDIVFIIDFFGSIGWMNWERIKCFVKVVISKFEVSFFVVYVVVILYSINFWVVFKFNSF